LLGAKRMNATPEDTLVFEDAKAGIDAGLAAGARVIAIAGDHPEEIPEDVEWVADLTALRVESVAGGKVRLVVV